MARPGVRGVALALLAGAGACASPAPPAPPAAPAPVRPAAATPAAAGAYTEAQAEAGRRVFEAACSSCHGLAEFRGRMFELTWMTRPVGHFFQHISTAMPQDRPGSLSPGEYASVVAYVLRLNGRPAGDRELPADVRALESLGWR